MIHFSYWVRIPRPLRSNIGSRYQCFKNKYGYRDPLYVDLAIGAILHFVRISKPLWICLWGPGIRTLPGPQCIFNYFVAWYIPGWLTHRTDPSSSCWEIWKCGQQVLIQDRPDPWQGSQVTAIRFRGIFESAVFARSRQNSPIWKELSYAPPMLISFSSSKVRRYSKSSVMSRTFNLLAGQDMRP